MECGGFVSGVRAGVALRRGRERSAVCSVRGFRRCGDVRRGRAVVAMAAPTEDDEQFDATAARAAELKDVIDGLLKFRQRIIDDTTAVAKKVKAPQKKLQESLAKHPDILKIDRSVVELESELKSMGYGGVSNQ